LTDEQIINDLQTYGLTEDEARVFVTLIILGPSRASALAKKLGINRMKAYRTLKRLQRLGLVEAILKRPTEFVAIPPKKALDMLIEAAKKKVQEMESKKKHVIENYKRISSTQITEEPRFRIIYGRRSVYNTLTKMFEESKEEINLVITPNGLYRFTFAGLDEVLKKCSKRGIKIRILTEIYRQGIPIAKAFLNFADIRHKKSLSKMRFIVVDNRETLTTVAMDDSTNIKTERDIGLWTNSKDYVATIKTFFQENWKESVAANLIIEAIETGKPIEEMKIINPEEYFNLHKRMIANSRSEILLLINNLQETLASSFIPETLEELKKRGVEVKILTPITAENMREAEQLSQHFQIRHLERSGNMQFLIVDRHEILITITHESQIRHMWSNIKEYAEIMAGSFEELWIKNIEALTRIRELRTIQLFKKALKELKIKLRKEGYCIKTPSEIKGGSGIKHKFDILIENLKTSKKVLVADILTRKDKTLPTLIALRTKLLDIQPLPCLLITPKNTLRDEEKELAKVYGIEILEETGSKEQITKILTIIRSEQDLNIETTCDPHVYGPSSSARTS